MRLRRAAGTGCHGGHRALLARTLASAATSSMPTALSVAARTSGGRSSAMFMLSVPSNSSHRAGRLLLWIVSVRIGSASKSKHLAEHGGANHEQHDPPAAMPVGLMAEIEHGRRGHQAHEAEQQQHRRPLAQEAAKLNLKSATLCICSRPSSRPSHW